MQMAQSFFLVAAEILKLNQPAFGSSMEWKNETKMFGEMGALTNPKQFVRCNLGWNHQQVIIQQKYQRISQS